MKMSEIRGLFLQPENGGLGKKIEKEVEKQPTSFDHVSSLVLVDKATGMFFTSIPGNDQANYVLDDNQKANVSLLDSTPRPPVVKRVINRQAEAESILDPWTEWNPGSDERNPRGKFWVRFRNGTIASSDSVCSWGMEPASPYQVIGYRPHVGEMGPGAYVEVIASIYPEREGKKTFVRKVQDSKIHLENGWIISSCKVKLITFRDW
jgi:hypothetical protein